jgi:hypothetical protein
MTQSTTPSTSVGWVSLHYGVPMLLFLALSGMLLHQCKYRFWRLQMLLHRVSDRLQMDGARKPTHVGGMLLDANGFDTQHHFHEVEQAPPRVRLAMAPVLAYGVVLLLVIPPSLLLAWAATLYFSQNKLMLAVAVALMGWCLMSLYYAIQYWHSGNIQRGHRTCWHSIRKNLILTMVWCAAI